MRIAAAESENLRVVFIPENRARIAMRMHAREETLVILRSAGGEETKINRGATGD
jgi:hypothetical protein